MILSPRIDVALKMLFTPKSNEDILTDFLVRFFNIKTEEDADMIAQANDTMINKAVYVLREMSADARAREIARQREKVLHDEASYLETARLEGRAEGRAEERRQLLAQLRALGVDEAMLSQAVSNLQ